MSLFDALQNELRSNSIELRAAELHGMLVGYACGAKNTSSEVSRSNLYRNWLGVKPPSKIIKILESAYSDAIENLDDFSDFEFRLLLPSDEMPIRDRVVAITEWCSGFLFGLGESIVEPDRLNEEVAEVLKDLSRISSISVELPESEENEDDLVEIEEFVRISVLLIFAEIRIKKTL